MQEDMAGVSVESKEYFDIVNKKFGSEDDRFQFYNSYALEKGFSVRRSYVEWNGASKKIIWRKLVCSREDYREEKHLKSKREDRKRKTAQLTI
jgi:zinc finger SWIM domain-containing protein 3